ncbi:hypothetical protein ACS0Y7_35260 [Burkholderia gladioli]|uniref:hypothetical protein n=1 Tax=Burkholderia gladioli TaxID=28095 RepID=UPI003F79575F
MSDTPKTLVAPAVAAQEGRVDFVGHRWVSMQFSNTIELSGFQDNARAHMARFVRAAEEKGKLQ